DNNAIAYQVDAATIRRTPCQSDKPFAVLPADLGRKGNVPRTISGVCANEPVTEQAIDLDRSDRQLVVSQIHDISGAGFGITGHVAAVKQRVAFIECTRELTSDLRDQKTDKEV